jgi:hypothetical protein
MAHLYTDCESRVHKKEGFCAYSAYNTFTPPPPSPPPPSSSYSSFSSSSSIGATTLGGFWPALRFCSTIFYLYTSLSSFSLSSSLDPLLLVQAISVFVFLLVLMSVVPIRLLFFNNSCCVHYDYMC